MVQWIKLNTDIFNNRKIMTLLTKRSGDSAFVVYIRLLCLAGNLNNSGAFTLSDGKPISIRTLASYMQISYSSFYRALKLLCELRLLVKDESGCYVIPNWSYHQNGEALRKLKDRERKRKARAKKKEAELDGEMIEKLMDEDEKNEKCPRTASAKERTCPHTEIDREKEKEKDICLSDERQIERDALSIGQSVGTHTDKNNPAFAEYYDSEGVFNEKMYAEDNVCERNTIADIGPLGHGYVTMTERQMEDLLSRMDVEAFNDYVSRLGEYLKKRDMRINSCYKIILKWFYSDIAVDGNRDYIR